MSLSALIEQAKQGGESWHYANLKEVEKLSFLSVLDVREEEIVLPAQVGAVRIVFIDGVFDKKRSVLNGLPLGFFSTLAQGRYVLDVKDQECLATLPVEIVYLSTAGAESDGQLFVSLGQNSRLTLLERHIQIGKGPAARQMTSHIRLDRQAKLVHVKTIDGKEESVHAAQTRVTIRAGAFYDRFLLIKDGLFSRDETNVLLSGDLANVSKTNALLLSGTAQANVVSSIRHATPHGVSRQLCKAVLTDKTRGAFLGNIHVAPDAQKTDANQLCRALLLSDKAEMDAKPELEIFADDVKCSHGCAVGDLDDQAMFYLQSRGIDRETARAMLVSAFIGDCVESIPSAEIAAFVRKEVEEWLSRP